MSTVAAGPIFTIHGPTPKAPPHSLLLTPDVRIAPNDDTDDRFPAAATIWGHPESTPSIWAECTTGTDRVKDSDSDVPEADFGAFDVYIPISCSFRGERTVVELEDKAREVLEATQSHAVERVLAHGHAMLDQPFFADENLVDLAPAGPVSPFVGLSILDQAIGGLTGRLGMIHATPAIVDSFGAIPVGDGSAIERLESANGTPIVSGTGYIDPEKDFSGDEAFDTVDWMFATGPVKVVVREEIFTPDLVEALDRDTNDWVMRPERKVFAYWDTALQVGVRVDWSL